MINVGIFDEQFKLLTMKQNYSKMIFDFYNNTRLSKLMHGMFVLALTLFSVTVNAQVTYTLNYTGTIQTLTLQAGTYDIKMWGADGGNSGNNRAGIGGYSNGTLTLPSTTTVYIGVGGAPIYPGGGLQPGGYNGGGTGYAASTGRAGGGASHIATMTGTLGALASNTSAVIIVAGGGGGDQNSGLIGHGGGLSGGGTYPGTQTGSSGSSTGLFGIFGEGGHVTTSYGGGGGGGWYGGGGNQNNAGSGGSGYIGGVSNGVTTMSGSIGFVTKPILTGDGLVIITELCNISLYAANNTNSLNPMICSGQSLTLTTNAISNYSWSTGATTSSLVVSPTTNTVYALTATSPSNCTASRTISVSVSSAAPILSIANPSNNICLGKTVSLTATGAITYTWANPGIVNGQTFTPSSTTVYTVTGQNGCGLSTATTTITVAPLAITAMASPTLVCEGNATTLTAITAATSFTWMPGSLPNFSTVVAPMANTIYTVSVSDGTCAGTQTVAVNTKVTPTINVSTSSFSVICEGDQLVITASGANSYTWSHNNQSGNTVTVSPNTTTVYVVTGENSVGCFATNQQIVQVLPTPTLIITASKLLVCSGQTVSLNPTGGNSYTWTNGPTNSPFVVTPIVTSVYTVTGGHNVNACISAKTITISALSPTLTLPTNTQVCIGSSVTVYASGADAYQWNSISTGSVGVYSTFAQTTTTVTLVATTKSLTTSCPTTHTFEIKANPLPSLTVTPKRAVVCRNETNTLTVSGAQNYTWTSTISGSSMVITPTTNLTYSVLGEDANGCVAIFNYQAKVNACVGINGSSKAADPLSVFPNPNHGRFTIKSESTLDLILVNELGQELIKCKLDASNDYSYEFTELIPGIYFIHDVNRAGTVVQKVIVN